MTQHRRVFHKRRRKHGIVSKRRKYAFGSTRAGKRRRRKRRVSKRLKRIIRSVANADHQVRWKDRQAEWTAIRDVANVADDSNQLLRIGVAATNGFFTQPINDIGGISIGTAKDQRTSQTIMLLGLSARVFVVPTHGSAATTNNNNKQWWVKLCWGWYHPRDNVAGYKVVPRDLACGVAADGAPGGGRSIMGAMNVLKPWGFNKYTSAYEVLDKVKQVGTKTFLQGEVTASTNTGVATDRFTPGHREYVGTFNWRMRRKFEFADGSNTESTGTNIPWICAYSSRDSNAAHNSTTNQGSSIAIEYRLYWKNLE